jgi:hypothetical protein
MNIGMISAQELPKWNVHREKQNVILSNYTDGKDTCRIHKLDSIVYRFLSDTIFYSPNIKAQFPGGRDSLSIFIQNNLNFINFSTVYPKVYVAFIVTKYGKLRNVGIYRGVDDTYNKEALEVVLKMPDWQPAVFENRYVNSYNILAINFTIR